MNHLHRYYKERILVFCILCACSYIGYSYSVTNNLDHPQVRITNRADSIRICKIWNLNDYDNPSLDTLVDSLMSRMNDRQKISQMVVVAYGDYGFSTTKIKSLLYSQSIGGVLMLHGEKYEFQSQIRELNDYTDSIHGIRILFSADAEPSLINQKIKGTPYIRHTNDLKSEQDCIVEIAKIDQELVEIGIQHNFAPVSDVSANKSVIGRRSFGHNDSTVCAQSITCIETSHRDNILATIKHFPGHGRVHGDSHKGTVEIVGEMMELDNFKKIIPYSKSVMVGHINLRDNPYADPIWPASCNPKVVTQLLRHELNFEGVIVTDAMNMGAVSKLPNADFQAVLAGNDMILMPLNEYHLIQKIASRYQVDASFKNRIDASVRRILKMKHCLGVIR